MEKTLEFLGEEFAAVRTGRANPALIEGLKVNAYGTTMSLRELATISAAGPQILYITPWDQTNIEPILKALRESSLNLVATEENGIVKLPVPSLSSERREELVKLIGEKTEKAKISIRQIRHEIIAEIEKREKERKITEDEKFRSKERIQKIIEEISEKIEGLYKQKENELTSI